VPFFIQPCGFALWSVHGRFQSNRSNTRSRVAAARLPTTTPQVHRGQGPPDHHPCPLSPVHLRHVEDCTATEAREKYYDELGGEECAWFYASRRGKHRKQRGVEEQGQGGGATRAAAASYQVLAIYAILSIKRVLGA